MEEGFTIQKTISIMHNFRKLNIWQDAMDVAQEVYVVSTKLPPEELYNLGSQLKRSAVSVPSNIAEGAGRNTNGEFNQFLGIATASSYELETQLLLCVRFNFIDELELAPLIERIQILQKKIYNFKKTL